MLTITVDFDTAKYLIEHKKSFHVSPADVNQYGITHVENDYTFSNSYENDYRYTIEKTLLHVAIENGHELAVELLIENGADPKLPIKKIKYRTQIDTDVYPHRVTECSPEVYETSTLDLARRFGNPKIISMVSSRITTAEIKAELKNEEDKQTWDVIDQFKSMVVADEISPLVIHRQGSILEEKQQAQDLTQPVLPMDYTIIMKPPASKGYRTRNPKIGFDDGSEGNSESDDPNVVWRGLNRAEYSSIEAGIEETAENFDLSTVNISAIAKEHIENGSNGNHQCCLISASRSKKMAARYAGNKLNHNPLGPSGMMVKIKLDPDTFRIDLTDPLELSKVGLSEVGKKFAENSQEILLAGPLLQKNIEEIYKVDSFGPWPKAQLQYRQHRDSDDGRSSFVKFRAYEKKQYHSFRITPHTVPAFEAFKARERLLSRDTPDLQDIMKKLSTSL